jgi:hypothetical protein
MSDRIQYRTPDGIIRLWIQEEIEHHLNSVHLSLLDLPPSAERDATLSAEQMGQVSPPRFEDEPVSVREEALLTVQMLYDLLWCRQPGQRFDHDVVQELLGRIDTMTEPLKEMVQALEVETAPSGIRRLAQEACQAIQDGHVEDGEFGGDEV